MLHLFDDVADSSSPRAELRRLTADHDAPLSEIDAEFIRRLLEAHVWTVTNATGPLRDACLSEAAHIYNSTFMVFADWQAIGTSDAIDDTAMTALVDLRDKCKGLVEDPATAIADRILSFQILEATNRVLNEAGQTAAVFRQLDSQDEPLAGKLFAMAKPSLIAEESLALIEKYKVDTTQIRQDRVGHGAAANGHSTTATQRQQFATFLTLIAMQTRIGNKTDAMALAADARRIWPARKSLAEIADAVKGILPNESN